MCVSKTFAFEIEELEWFRNDIPFYLSIRAKSRSGLTSAWEREISKAMTAGSSPVLLTLTPTKRTIRVTWNDSLDGSPTKFLVLACPKKLSTGKCGRCLIATVNGSHREAEVNNLRPATDYQVQIEAIGGNYSGLSAADETKTHEDSKCINQNGITCTTNYGQFLHRSGKESYRYWGYDST